MKSRLDFIECFQVQSNVQDFKPKTFDLHVTSSSAPLGFGLQMVVTRVCL